MSKKRPTESSWESDEEFLLEDTSGISAFSKKTAGDEEVIDEDALLGIGENTDKAFLSESGPAYEIQLDDSGTALFDMTGESQEVLDYEDTFQELDEQIEYQIEEPLVVESEPNRSTTTIKTAKPRKAGGVGNESGDSDSEEEKKKRDRFKTERQTVSLKPSKHTAVIPDKLEVTKEMQAEIESFEKQKNQKGRKNQYQQRQHQMRNQRNQGQFRQPRPTGPRGFNHQQRGSNPNFGPRQQNPRGPRPNGPQGFQQQSAPQQMAPRPMRHQGPGPYPHQIVGQNNFSAPQPFSQHQPQGLLPDPIPQMSPQPSFSSQGQFNPNPASLVQSNAGPTIHVNPNFHGNPSPDHHHQPQHVLPQNHYPSPQPLMQQQQQHQVFMHGPRPHMDPGPRPHMDPGPRPGLMDSPRPGLMEPPRPNFIPQQRPLLDHPRQGAPFQQEHHQQQMFHNNNRGPSMRHPIPPGQFQGPGGPPMHHQPHPQRPNQPHPQPRHPGQNMQQPPRPMHQQGQPRHQPPQHVRPQRFQNQQRGPVPHNPQGFNPNPGQQMPPGAPIKQEPDPEQLAKQMELEERKRRRLERFSQNTPVVPAGIETTKVKISTGQKRPSTEGTFNISPPKVARVIQPKNLNEALEQQKRMREKIRQMKETQRQAQAAQRRQQLQEKLAKEGKSLADFETNTPSEGAIQTIQTINTVQQQRQQDQQQYQQQQQQHQQVFQPQQQMVQRGGIRGRAGHSFPANRGQNVRGAGQQMRGRGQMNTGRGQVMRGRGQSNVGRGQVRARSAQGMIESQGQPISVLGQSPVQDTGSNTRGRGQVRGVGRGNQIRSNILQPVKIQETLDIQPDVNVTPKRTVIPAGQSVSQHRQPVVTNFSVNSKGAASQGQGSGRIVVANLQQGQKPQQKRTVLKDSAAQRRVVANSFGGGTSSVAIEGLSTNVNLGIVNGYCSSIGEVKNFNYMANEHKVLVRFANPDQSAKFVKKYNRQMVDLAMIRVKPIPDF